MCRHQSGQVPERAQAALDQHRQIARAIAARDEELAELLMRRHISGAWEIVKTILEKAND
jgi:DNA-binding GntR family transcriptional regulator